LSAELIISEEDATKLQIGFRPRQGLLPYPKRRRPVAGFVGYADGQLEMPPAWIGTNVAKPKRTFFLPAGSRTG
jgi:hypothetical protein